MTRIIFAILIFFTIFVNTGAQAKRAMLSFGKQDYIRYIQNVDIVDGENRELYLGYLLTRVNFVGGLYLEDNGYVLGVKDKDIYYSLLTEDITDLQASGKLPKPLPEYKIGLMDYIFGYIVWLIIFILVAWALIKKLFIKKLRV